MYLNERRGYILSSHLSSLLHTYRCEEENCGRQETIEQLHQIGKINIRNVIQPGHDYFVKCDEGEIEDIRIDNCI